MARDIKFRLLGDPTDFKKGAQEAATSIDKLADKAASRLGSVGDVFGAMGSKGLIAAAGVGAVTAAVTGMAAAFASSTTGAAAHMDKLAGLRDQADLSVASLQKMEVAAKLGNTSVEALAGATNKAQSALVNGSKAFEKLGLDIERLKQLAPEDMMREVSTEILALGTAAERTTAMRDVFGKSGPEMIGAMRAMASGASELGGALSDEAADSAAALQDQLDLLSTATERVSDQFGAAVSQSPELQQAIEDITDIVVDLAEGIADATPTITKFFDAFVTGARMALATGKGLAGIAGGIMTGRVLGIGDTFQQMLADQDQIGLDAMFSDVRGGGSSSALDRPRRRYRGAADDKAAEEAAKRAAEIERLLEKVHQGERERWAKDLETAADAAMKNAPKFAQLIQRDLQGQGLKELFRVVDPATGLWTRYADVVEQELDNADDAVQDHMEELQELADEEAFEVIVDNLGAIGAEAMALGEIIPGAFGKALQAAGQLSGGVASVMANLKGMRESGGGIGGVLGKVAGGLGIAGAIGGAISFIGGLFGGPSEEEKQKRKEAIEDTLDQLEQIKRKIESIRMERLQSGLGGVAAIMAHLNDVSDLTQDRFNNVGLMGAAMFAEMRRQGASFAEAFEAATPALEQAAKVAEEHGLKLEGAFGMMAEFAARVGENRGLVDAVEGLGSVAEALRVNGMLNQDSGNSLMAELAAQQEEMAAAGFTMEEQVALSARALFNLREAAEDGHVALDAETQSMIDLAEASGAFEGLEDPMDQIVEALEMMNLAVAELVKAIGGDLPQAVQDYINSINSIPGIPGVGVTGPPSIHGGPASGIEIEGLAAGGVSMAPRVAVVGEGGPEGHIPLEGGGAALVAQAIAAHMPGFGPITLQMVVDRRVLAETHIDMLRSDEGGLASETARRLGLG